ncbi:Rv1733c family protein [Streptomyces sp. NPDC054796]
MRAVRSIVGLWRWRGNPLCRRSDRREAWLAFWAVVLIVLGAPLVGWLGTVKAHDALLSTVEQQRQNRHQVWASAESLATRPPVDTDPESAAEPDTRRQVTARWTGPDGTSHSGTVRAGHGVQPGERFRIWTDDQGRIASRPMTERSAGSHAALAGLAAAAGTAGALEAARRLAIRQVMRRRYARWDAEWHRIGPDWGRTGTSN